MLADRAEGDVEGVGDLTGRSLGVPHQAQDLPAAWLGDDLDSVVPEAVGGVVKASFPDMPMTWDLEIVELTEPTRVVRKAIAGPPYWAGTTIVFELAQGEDGGTVLRFDHLGFSEVNDMFRIVTVGWAQVLGNLKVYAETGTPTPFFDF